jgi:hypothetical protein
VWSLQLRYIAVNLFCVRWESSNEQDRQRDLLDIFGRIRYTLVTVLVLWGHLKCHGNVEQVGVGVGSACPGPGQAWEEATQPRQGGGWMIGLSKQIGKDPVSLVCWWIWKAGVWPEGSPGCEMRPGCLVEPALEEPCRHRKDLALLPKSSGKRLKFSRERWLDLHL